MLGVLHGGREADRERVSLARAGDATSLAELRRVHARKTRGDAESGRKNFRSTHLRNSSQPPHAANAGVRRG